MARRLQRNSLPLVVLSACFVLLPDFSRAQVPEEQTPAVIVEVHSVAGLPVWQVDAQGAPHFDPSTLITLIRTQVAPESWNHQQTLIEPDEKHHCLLIYQTPANLREIGRLLRRLRAFNELDPAARLRQNLDTAEIALNRVLLFVADPYARQVDEFFAAQDGESGREELQAALDNYVIQYITPAQARELNAWGMTTASAEDPTRLSILGSDGKIVAEAGFEQFERGGEFQPGALAEFLREHRLALPDAQAELDSALATARKADKRVILQMGGPNCGPCILLSRYFESQKALFEKDFVHLKLDARMPSADSVRAAFGETFHTVPWMVILSHQGDVLATSLSEDGNIGFPQSEKAREHFRRMLVDSSRRLSEADIATAIGALEE